MGADFVVNMGRKVLIFPWEEDPRVLSDFGYEMVGSGLTLWFYIETGIGGIGQKSANGPEGISGIGQIIDDKAPAAIAAIGRGFQDADIALRLMIVAFDADGLDGADIEVTGNQTGGNKATPGDSDDFGP